MTRTKSTYLALLAVLFSPMAANADSIRLEWSGTGLADVTAATGDILSLDVILNSDGNTWWHAVSVDFSTAMLQLLSVTDFAPDPGFSSSAVTANAGDAAVYDSTGDGVAGLPDLVNMREFFFTPNAANDFNGDFIVNFIDLALLKTNFGAGSAVAPSSSNVLHLGNPGFNPAFGAGDRLLATMSFLVTGAGGGSINPFFNPGVDGVFNNEFADITSRTALLGATVNGGSVASVPEPSTLALLGLGLLGMAATRRRRKV